jgi:TetR/AcrR family transcriptional regulator, tetracycline repressor protein
MPTKSRQTSSSGAQKAKSPSKTTPAAKRKAVEHESTTGKTLNREKIVAVALDLIDLHGLNAFSLREVARQLDVYPTAVYWYLPNRDALLAAIVESTMAGVTPEHEGIELRVWLRELFMNYRDAIRMHPNVAQLVGAQLVSNASLSPLLIDRILCVLLNAGCPETRLVDMYNVVVASMVGFATLEFAPLPTDDPKSWATRLENQVHDIRALEYPTLARYLPSLANRAFIVRWQSGAEVPLETSFATFVEVAIDGIQRQIEKFA